MGDRIEVSEPTSDVKDASSEPPLIEALRARVLESRQQYTEARAARIEAEKHHAHLERLYDSLQYVLATVSAEDEGDQALND